MITSDFSAYAVRAIVHLPAPVMPEQVRVRLVDLMNSIASECERAGATLIGHIKCVLDAGENGFLAVSVTDASGNATVRGEIKNGIGELNIVFNVLLYGLTRSRVQEIVDPLVKMRMSFEGARIKLEDLEKEHQHEHGPVPIRMDGLDGSGGRDHGRQDDHC